MSDIWLYEKAKRRLQEKIKARFVTDTDIIVYQEKEIMYYRDKINKLTGKSKNKSDSNINIKIDIEADEAKQELKELNEILEEIKDKTMIIKGIDFGQTKDYTTICTYQAGVLVKEETTQYK